MMLSPISGRRGLSLTRDNIKSLINKDEDIKKILKDLVRVTMNKVDLNTRKSGTPSEKVTRRDRETEKKEEDDYLETEQTKIDTSISDQVQFDFNKSSMLIFALKKK